MDSEILIYIIVGLIFFVGVSIDHKAKGGLKRGNNLIHENKTFEDVGKIDKNYNYSYCLDYNPRIGIVFFIMTFASALIALDLFIINETTSFLYRSVAFYVGLGTLLFSLIWLINRLKKKELFPNGIIKIGEKGLWTEKLGDISWLSIRTIIVRVALEGTGRKTEIYYLEIVKFDKKQDCINMIDIKFDRNKLIDLIDNYAQQYFEKHKGLDYWQID